MKRRKSLLLIVALLLSVLALFLTGGVALMHGTPEYYRPTALTREQIEAASQRAEQTLTRMQNLAADSHVAQLRAQNGATNPATVASSGNTFTFSEDELNALFQKWAELHGWREYIDRLVSDPIVILKPGRVILAGQSKLRHLDTVVSLHFSPALDEQGRFDLNLMKVTAGKLPLPQEAVMGPVRDRAFGAVHVRLPAWQQRARISPSGIANQ